MNELAKSLAEIIQRRLDASQRAGATEIRLIFHGPPLEILTGLFDQLVDNQKGQEFPVPIVLQLPSLRPGARNPRVGESGHCDEAHLLNIRNSPSRSSYLALIPPGQQSIRSVSSTSEEFGVSAYLSGGNVQFDEWWADEFIQELVARGIERAGIEDAARDDARILLARAAEAMDGVDGERTQREAAWRLISRLYSASALAVSPGDKIGLACGMPPMASGRTDAKSQAATLEKIADALEDGFSAGIAKISSTAPEPDQHVLDAFLQHIRKSCDRPTAFQRGTAAFYAPVAGLEAKSPPPWWQHLTVEKWDELLQEEVATEGDIRITCPTALLNLGKATPVIFADEVALDFEATGEDSSQVAIGIVRSGKAVGEVKLAKERTFVDPAPPSHRSPLRYVANADGYKPAAIKVISLATWAPGIFVACRLARKLAPPKRSTSRGNKAEGLDWETSLTIPGIGRYELQIFAGPDIDLGEKASLTMDESDDVEQSVPLDVRKVKDGMWQIEVEADRNVHVDIEFKRAGVADPEICRAYITSEEVAETGCRSEFERLIRANRIMLDSAEARSIVQIDRSVRSASFQEWTLSAESVKTSFLPVVLAEDYVDAWVQPTWGAGPGPIFSKGKFIQDPRPSAEMFKPPNAFLASRQEIAARIRGDDNTGLVESATLGKWVRSDPAFRTTVEAYLDAYQTWLAADPAVACWVDAIMVTPLEDGGRTLARVPDAILLSPLHPLRLAWQCLAQSVLVEADEASKPCPAASVLDPDCVPDMLTLFLQSASGIDTVPFLSVENGTDYWSVLWNGHRLNTLAQRSRLAPFGQGFGISVGGISGGFSAAQVRRALEDVSDLLSAKPQIRVAITSAGGTTDACNDGLISWCFDRYRDTETAAPRQALGPRLVDVYDDRDETLRPDAATIANISEDTRNGVRWFNRQPEKSTPDLGIIAQLDMSEPSASAATHRSPLGFGALIRHRIRRQLPRAFLSESRQAAPAEDSDDAFADKVAKCAASLENMGDGKIGLQFAPNINAIHEMLTTRRTDYVAVSSSAVDPASFLGGWLKDAYLWDYDLPSYSHRAGDTNGYYLLSAVKDADRASLSKALAKLPGCNAIEPDKVQDVLLEVARRGIPTIRGLAGEDSGTTGDLGLFVAVRLLQDRFRIQNSVESLLPVLAGTEDDTTIAIVVPVDPFRSYLSDIFHSLRRDRKEQPALRPDLLVIGAHLTRDRVRLHLTPIEVKCRPGSTYPPSEWEDALGQAKSLSRLLTGMLPSLDQPKVWTLGFQHLLLSFVSFGMRVYSQHPDVLGHEARWCAMHERLASAILGGGDCVTVDPRGRLIIIDDSPRSIAKDADGDGFDETIVIGRDDAGVVVTGDPSLFYSSVRAKVGTWDLFPPAEAAKAGVAPVSPPQPHATPPRSVSLPTGTSPENPSPPAAAAPVSQPASQAAGPDVVPQHEPPPPTLVASPSVLASQPSQGVLLSLGKTVNGFTPKDLALNVSDTRLNQLNIGVVGDLGTGKTQLLKSLILQVASASSANRGIKPRFLIFDYKRDYSSDDFVKATGAKVVRPHKLPLNLFDTTGVAASQTPWMDRYRFFTDVLDKIYTGIGPVQRDKLKRAVRSAYDAALGTHPPTLNDVHAAYSAMLDGKSDSPMSIIGDLVDMEIFEPDASKVQAFDQFLDGVVVVSLDALGQDDHSKNMVVAIMLNMFYENMLKTPKRDFVGTDPQLRAIDSYLLVDEADNIMQYEFPVLRRLLLQGREFGTGVILASQYLRHFKVGATDYREPLLTWFVHKVPNVLPAELSALGFGASAADLAEQVKSLKNHHCLYKSYDNPGEVVRGLPFFEFIRTQRPEEH